MHTTANNFQCGIYDDGEIWIQTEPRQLESNGGKVFLTILELRRLLELATSNQEEGI